MVQSSRQRYHGFYCATMEELGATDERLLLGEADSGSELS